MYLWLILTGKSKWLEMAAISKKKRREDYIFSFSLL